jgi:hypothetical protein
MAEAGTSCKSAHTCLLVVQCSIHCMSAQWHGEHHEESDHEDMEDGVQTITKEMDMAHLEHAGFDPEAAAFEDGNDVEDLGYDEDIEPGVAMRFTLLFVLAMLYISATVRRLISACTPALPVL